MMPILAQVFKNKFLKEKFSVGLDIGTSELKLIKTELDKENQQLTSFLVEPVGQNLGAALKRIAQEQGLKKVNISVSGPSAIIRYVSLPRMTEEELKQAVKFEVEKHIPFPVSEVNADAHILRNDLADNKMLVLIAAVKKEFLNQRIKLLEEAGLRINTVAIDSVALVNAFNFNYPELDKTKAVALLNIGAAFSNLNILEGGSPRLSRDIHIAGNNFTRKIADTLGVDLKVAEALKLNPDKERLEKVNSAVDLVLSQLAIETRISFDYHESQSASTVAKIFLSGGASLYPGLKENLANALGVGVDYWDPFKQITLSPQLDALVLKLMGAKLATAAGLALL